MVDSTVISFLGSFERGSYIIDSSIRFIVKSKLLQGNLFMMIIWWIWFENDKRTSINRLHIIATLMSCFVVMAFTKILEFTLPFRLRPLQNGELKYLFPIDITTFHFENHSSFPSDTAALFFALSAGLFIVSRKVGIFAFVYATLFIAFPKIYLGLHYPTDIIAGAIIGMSIVWLGNLHIIRANISERILSWERSKPGYFYALFFFITYQIADLFTQSQEILKAIYKASKQLLHY